MILYEKRLSQFFLLLGRGVAKLSLYTVDEDAWDVTLPRVAAKDGAAGQRGEGGGDTYQQQERAREETKEQSRNLL